MSIRLRREEKEAVIAALDAEYDSAEGAATAVFQLVAELIAKRDSYGVRVAWGPGVLLGPVYDKRQAAKVAALAGHTFAREGREAATGVIPLASAAKLLGANVGLLDDGSDPRYCQDCEHPVFGHVSGPWVKPKGKIKQPAGCMVDGCKCKSPDGKTSAKIPKQRSGSDS